MQPDGCLLPQSEVAADLTVLDEALALEEADKLAGGDLWHAAHQGTPMASSSTCTKRSFCGTGWS